MIDEFKRQILRLRTTAFDLEKEGVDLSEDFSPSVTDYTDSRREYLKRNYYASLDSLKTQATHLHALTIHNSSNAKPITTIIELITTLPTRNASQMRKELDKIWTITDVLDIPEADSLIPRFSKPGHQEHSERQPIIKSLPTEVRGDLIADINEMEKCYANKCYRSVTILCGRILETALH
ncbi:MAG: hypothetical protein AABX52_00540, partial [Nanoarchaeota archaeon]